MTTSTDNALRLQELLADETVETRLNAAMAAGTRPDALYVEALIERCRVEPDFFVRDTLTWALLMQPRADVIARLAKELWRAEDQARSQALHTLSKVGDKSTWPLITLDMIHDADDQVARTAWRAAAALVPDDAKAALAREFASELGRGDIFVQRSLSRSMVALGDVIEPVLDEVENEANPAVAKERTDGRRTHAIVTRRLFADPDLDFEIAVEVAKSVVAQSNRIVHKA